MSADNQRMPNAQPKPRRHVGDIMSPAKRSALMAKIKGKGTGPERAVAEALTSLGLSWQSHVRALPGCPDFVFEAQRVAVFIDGDFWHGWRFPVWRDKLSEKWEAKIEANRQRDRRNHRRLRAMDWRVVRIWEHQLSDNLDACLKRILTVLWGSGPMS
jgi:DNA mismatch endonuclease (patch repair protein)